MPILCIANHKGGVGKTTTAVNLAAGLARRGRRVLLVDLDIQGSASATLRPAPAPGAAEGPSVADCLLGGQPIAAVAAATSTPGLWLAASCEGLAAVDLQLSGALARERVVERCLASAREEFDVVIVDTAPYLGLLTVNALVAATHLLVPVSCEYLPVLGLKLFNETLDRVRASLGARAELVGYLLTMYDRRERITLEVEELLRKRFGDAVLARPIRVDTRHKAAPSHRKTIFEFEGPSARGRSDYEWLSGEVDRRLGHLMGTGRATAERSATGPGIGTGTGASPDDSTGDSTDASRGASPGAKWTRASEPPEPAEPARP